MRWWLWLCLCAAVWAQPPSAIEPATVPMPKVVGVKLDQAQARLKEARFPEPRIAHTAGAEGMVIRQIPAAGTPLTGPSPTPLLFVGTSARPQPAAAASPAAPPPRPGPPRTNWLVLAVTAAALLGLIGLLAARWLPETGELKIKRRVVKTKTPPSGRLRRP